MLQPFIKYDMENYCEIKQQSSGMIGYYGKISRELRFVPDGCVELLYQIQNNTATRHFIFKKELLHVSGERSILYGVRLRPGYTAACPEGYLEETGTMLMNVADAKEGISYLMKSITPYIKPVSDHPVFLTMLDLIQSTGGRVTVEQLARQYGYTSRHIYNMFHDAFGVGAKDFCRCVRFQWALQAVLAEPERGNSYYMEQLSYSDQAHFQREFKQFTGMTPRQFIKKVLQGP